MMLQKLKIHKWIICGLIYLYSLYSHAYPAPQSNVDYLEIDKKGFLITYDDKDSTVGYYLSLPFTLKNIYWDDPTYILYLTIGSDSPSPEEHQTLKSRFFLRKLYPLPTETLSIAWDDFLLSSSDSKVLYNTIEPLDEIQIVFKLTPLRYKKLKDRFNEKIPLSITGIMDLTYRSTTPPTISATQIIHTHLPNSPQVLIFSQVENQLHHTQVFFSLF